MRTVDFNPGKHDPEGCVDWKATPQEVLEQIDEMIAPSNLEIVIFEANSDVVLWNIEMRKDPT